MSLRSSVTSLFGADSLTYMDLGIGAAGGTTGAAAGGTTSAFTGAGATDLRFFDLTFRVLFGLTASTGATTGATMGEIAGGGGATTGGTTGGTTFDFRVFLGFEFTFRVFLTLIDGVGA